MTRKTAGNTPVNRNLLPFGSGVILPIIYMTSKTNQFSYLNICINMYQTHTIYVISSRLLISHRKLRKKQHKNEQIGSTLTPLSQ